MGVLGSEIGGNTQKYVFSFLLNWLKLSLVYLKFQLLCVKVSSVSVLRYISLHVLQLIVPGYRTRKHGLARRVREERHPPPKPAIWVLS